MFPHLSGVFHSADTKTTFIDLPNFFHQENIALTKVASAFIWVNSELQPDFHQYTLSLDLQNLCLLSTDSHDSGMQAPSRWAETVNVLSLSVANCKTNEWDLRVQILCRDKSVMLSTWLNFGTLAYKNQNYFLVK